MDTSMDIVDANQKWILSWRYKNYISYKFRIVKEKYPHLYCADGFNYTLDFLNTLDRFNFMPSGKVLQSWFDR